MPSLRSIALATMAVAALVPAAASAKTYCVFAPECTGTPAWSIQDAVNAAEGDNEPVRIELDEGTYSGNVVVPAHPQGIEIVGRGADKTVLEPTDGGTYALALHGGGAVSQVRFSLPNIGYTGPHGLLLADGARAEDIRAVVPSGYGAEPVRIEHGGHLAHAYIDSPGGLGIQVSSNQGAGDTTITDSYVRGASPLFVESPGHTVTASRDRLVATSDYDAVHAIAGAAVVEDSLLDIRGQNSAALSAVSGSPSYVSVEGRHVTVLADAPQSTGLSTHATSGDGSATATLSDSLLRGVALRAERTGSGGVASVALRRVDTWPAAPDSVPAAGFVDEGSFSADPLLGADLVPGPGSPLIDVAAMLGAGESATDLDGTARTLDGDGSCDARPDVGALEAAATACTPPPPAPGAPNIAPQPPAAGDTAAPLITKLRVAHRRAVRFRLSEAARVTVRIKRAHRKALVLRRAVKGGSVSLKLKRALRHGRYAIRVIAMDGAGNRSAPALLRKRV